jgi:AraC-like DNA-binding protein
MMTLLVMKARELAHIDSELARLIDQGALKEAAARAKLVLDARGNDDNAADRVAIGRALLQVLLGLNREVEAEELVQQQMKLYASVPRAETRMLLALDHGLQMLAMNRIGRAAESVSPVLEAAAAPAPMRIEGLLILSECLQRLGEHQAACRTLDAAMEHAQRHALHELTDLVDLQRIDQGVRSAARPPKGNGDHALCMPLTDASVSPAAATTALFAALQDLQPRTRHIGLLAQRVEQLENLLRVAQGKHLPLALLAESLHWLQQRGLAADEERFRIEAGLACLVGAQLDSAGQLLQPLIFDEARARHHKFAHELQYCIARLHVHQGRLAEAMRAYSAHAGASINMLRTDLPRVKLPLDVSEKIARTSGDAETLRLPPRYRCAYRYLLEHLGDASLCVKRVAAEAGVTTRMLQIVFREHLGCTPAELIRSLRLHRIRDDLRVDHGVNGVLHVANRWGISNRSALVKAFRRTFDEAPTESVHGSHRPRMH